MTKDDVQIDDERLEGGIVSCPGEYYDDLVDLSKMLVHNAPLQEAARLAMALPRHSVTQKLSEGFEYFLTPNGAKCAYQGSSDELFLLIRRVNGRADS